MGVGSDEMKTSRFQVFSVTSGAYDNPMTQGVSVRQLDQLPGESVPPRRPSFIPGMRRGSRRQSLQIAGNAALQDTFTDFIFDEEAGTFRPQYTLDATPRVEHYRNIFSISKHVTRPTLDELHGALGPGQRPLARVSIDDGGESDNKAGDGTIKFGWIRGVFMRCLLNIWGVMLFLRMGWMTGQAGIGLSILIVAVASIVTTLTTLSMSAICTNGEVRGGGAYYMISRSLGPQFGGAIGIIFSFANAVAVSMYIVGAAETVRDLLRTFDSGIVEYPSDTNDVRISGICFLVLMTAITGVGMAFENKAQIFLLIMLLVALMDYFVGACLNPTLDQRAKGFVGWNVEVGTQNFGPDFRGESFFSVFSVFFPSVTGILAGANISGDLRDACTAIPKGTFLAIISTSGSYVVIIIWLGFTLLRDATGNIADVEDGSFGNCTDRPCPHGMLNYFQVMEMSSGFGPLIYAGIFAATLSSALAALISAPRIFQALCKDKIFPCLYYFAKGYGPNNDPRRASALVFLIALLCTIIAELNVIAPIISNFFMASYSLINFSCFHASLVKSPGFRPGFKYYNMWLSLAGSILCVVVMFIMNWITALVTFGIVLFLYIYISLKKPDVNWGSSTQGYMYKNALTSIVKLNKVEEHVKNYRPAVLVLTGNPSSRPPLVDFAHLITKKLGLMVCGHIMKGPISRPLRNAIVDHNYQWLWDRKVDAFYSLIESDSLSSGAHALLQLVGMGKMRPNILLMGYKTKWYEKDPDDLLEYFNTIHHALDMHLAFGILRLEEGLDYANYFETCNGVPFSYCPAASSPMDSSVGNSTVTLPPSVISTIMEEESGDAEDAEENEDSSDLPPPPPASLHRFRRLDSVDITKCNPREIPPEVTSAVDQFQQKQTDGTIDVWWLYDDGGLTLLVPYLLTTRSQFSGCKLRVFSVAQREGDLDSTQINMAALLKKFRINFTDLSVLTDANIPPQEDSKNKFKNLISKFLTTEETTKNPLSITKTDLATHKDKTNRQIRLRELLIKYSRDATLIVMTLPMPRKGSCPPPLYMAWLETLTRDLPPVLLIRGNQTSVLTFYS